MTSEDIKHQLIMNNKILCTLWVLHQVWCVVLHTVIYVYIASCDWTSFGKKFTKAYIFNSTNTAQFFSLIVLGTNRTKVFKCYLFSCVLHYFFATVKLPFFFCFSYHIVLYVSLKHFSVFPGNWLDKRFCLALLALPSIAVIPQAFHLNTMQYCVDWCLVILAHFQNVDDTHLHSRNAPKF